MEKKRFKLYQGDNLENLKKLPDNSVDSVVTDPPYGLSFMNKKWDYDVPSVELWKEVYRVLKPGGHLLSFGGTRTYHRMVVNIEDAGFEIRDQIMWLYGSGFPKSLNIGKAVDKLNGVEVPKNKMRIVNSVGIDNYDDTGKGRRYDMVDYEVENEWKGWGTALKPANEPICVARKPLSEKTVAKNVLKWGTGGINVDGCRVGSETNEGRFPANIILECICDEVIKGEKGDIHLNPDCPCRLLDEQSGVSSSQKRTNFKKDNTPFWSKSEDDNKKVGGHNDKGGASRFFYQAKVSKKERNMGIDEKNNHPTVKPINLMTYLCRLVTPKNGIVLDPYMGSGSTGISALLEGFRFVGMEMDEDYIKIAEARIENFEKYRELLK